MPVENAFAASDSSVESSSRRERCRVPFPHDLLQSDQSSQGLHTQYSVTPQCCVLHASIMPAVFGSHGMPPCRGFFMMCRKRVRSPPPQGFPQLPHSPQSPHVQSWVASQRSSLQLATSSSAPSHGFPPLFGSCTMVRVRLWLPPSQSAVQVSQSLHSDSTQSAGSKDSHCPVLQGPICLVAPVHWIPPCLAYVAISRSRVCTPLQFEEHGSQLDHSANAQSWMPVLQGPRLHFSNSSYLPSAGCPQ
mmetsp:Transcript_3655/g.8746  ORF Transcript_3655/g.8746 Transcript_3655/m.8746 type:complete len:247 (-) Transcript_3655:2393-3133(-)